MVWADEMSLVVNRLKAPFCGSLTTPPGKSSVDNEEIEYLSDGGSIQFSRSFDAGEPDGGTPRPALYLQEVNLDLLKRGGVTPPIVRSDGEKPGDPFEEEEEEEKTKKSKEEIIL